MRSLLPAQAAAAKGSLARGSREEWSLGDKDDRADSETLGPTPT